MKQKYSEEFVEQAVVKLLTRGKRTVREVALDLNVNYHTAKNWMQRGSPDKATAFDLEGVESEILRITHS